jgi:hypothetical protein
MMHITINHGLQRGIRYFLLRGHGWRTRTRLQSGVRRREWRDPLSGHWYGAAMALQILRHRMIALYPEPDRRSDRFSLRC